MANKRASGGARLAFQMQDLHCSVDKHAFAMIYVSAPSFPRYITTGTCSLTSYGLDLSQPVETLALVVMLFHKSSKGTQFLGSGVMDVSLLKTQAYCVSIHDASTRPHTHVGAVTLNLIRVPDIPCHLTIQSPQVVRAAFDAAEANLTWIRGFGARGLPPIENTHLKMIHSPYYVNHLGVTLPSGAFCMIPTSLASSAERAIASHRERFMICLKRNLISPEVFVQRVSRLMSGAIKSKHLKCLVVVADTLTMHTRVVVEYVPDSVYSEHPKGTERWEMPREPTLAHGETSYIGDCEDFAREVYQHAKEIAAWVTPALDKSPMEALSAILHMYVPTIEQGAVDKNAVSDLQRKIIPDADYRNHIWAALHPRHSFGTKLLGKQCSLDALYAKWPKQACEQKIPLLMLEGTGDVYPIVTATEAIPEFMISAQREKERLETQYPYLKDTESPDMGIQLNGESDFYKYAIACMSDVFADQGFLDYTYVTNHQYGVNIYDWTRGKYRMRVSSEHTPDVMQHIRDLIALERPIDPIETTSTTVQVPDASSEYAVRFGQSNPFDEIPPGATLGTYNIENKTWHELYFPF